MLSVVLPISKVLVVFDIIRIEIGGVVRLVVLVGPLVELMSMVTKKVMRVTVKVICRPTSRVTVQV